MKNALTEQQIAAMAAGATIAAAVTPAPVETVAAVVAPVVAAVVAAPVVAAVAAPVEAPAVAQNDAVITLLQSQSREAQASVLALTIENAGLKSKLATVETTHTGLVKIAAASLSNMKVALGFSAIDASAMSAEAVLVEHAATSDAFATRFKAGGVAAIPAVIEAADDKVDALADIRRQAVIAGNRYTR